MCSLSDDGLVVDPDVVAHYELGLEESRLFLDGRPRLEYLRTLELMHRFLPPPPARVLDVGGGTGVYAVALCERGYSVHVVDPVARHIERALQIAHELGLTEMSASLGDARELATIGPPVDAVLLLGPLYHLTDSTDRSRAFAEAVRAARPGALVMAAGISRFASLIDGLKRRILTDPSFRRIVERDLHDGQHRNPDVQSRPEFFTTAYFHRPEDLEREARAAGLCDVKLFAIEGPSWIVEDPADLESQLFAARATESEPALMAATSHIMVIGTTPIETR